METREKVLWQIANTVMVNHQFINTADSCAEQAEASLLLFKASRELEVDIYRDFAQQCFERCISLLPQMSQKAARAGWAISRILNEGWILGDMDGLLYEVDRKIIPVLNQTFDFGNETKGHFILPHFYLLERHKKNPAYWTAQSHIVRNLKDAVCRHKNHGGTFSAFCKESIDRFLLSLGEQTVFSGSYPGTLHVSSPEELAAQAWRFLLYGQNITWTFSGKDLTDYIQQRIADFDGTEDLNLRGLPGIGLVI